MTTQVPLTPRRRYWRLVGGMAALAVIGALGTLGYLLAHGFPLRLHAILAIGLGITASLILAGVLMGLVFLSARAGYDEAASNPDDEDH